MARDIVFNTDGAMNHSLGFLIMVHDNSDGELVCARTARSRSTGRGADGADTRTPTRSCSRRSRRLAARTSNPRWHNSFLGKHLITAHPMGGCATADNVDAGVVDHAGRVFPPDGGTYGGTMSATRL